MCQTRLIVVIHVCEYECVELCVCAVPRKQKNVNCSIKSGTEEGDTRASVYRWISLKSFMK